MKSVKRDIYLNRLIDRKENGLIKIITGVRRCGKSYLLFKLFYDYLVEIGVEKENIIKVALDEDENRSLRDPNNLSEFLKSKIKDEGKTYYIFLDEVQYVISGKEVSGEDPIRLYGILNGLINRGNVDVYVTGSNSKFLSSDILTEFRGRGDEIRVNPFTFSEFFSAYGGDKYEAFSEFSTYGGLPLILSKKNEIDKSKYLLDLVKETYVKDIVERNKLQGETAMEILMQILASSVGSLTNPHKLANSFNSSGVKISDVTVQKYISYLENSFIISRAGRYDIKGKKYIASPYKYYYTDIGLRNAVLNFRQQEQTHIMENIIYNELIVRGYNVDVGEVIYTKTFPDGRRTTVSTEVDFVCNLGSRRYYIQSAFSIPDRKKMEQETASLDRLGDSFKKIIVVGDIVKPWTNEKGYFIINVYDFLLNPDSLNL